MMEIFENLHLMLYAYDLGGKWSHYLTWTKQIQQIKLVSTKDNQDLRIYYSCDLETIFL